MEETEVKTRDIEACDVVTRPEGVPFYELSIGQLGGVGHRQGEFLLFVKTDRDLPAVIAMRETLVPQLIQNLMRHVSPATSA